MFLLEELSSVEFLSELQGKVLQRGCRVLSTNPLKPGEDVYILDGGMTTLSCFMQYLGLCPPPEREWCINLDGRITRLSSLRLLEELLGMVSQPEYYVNQLGLHSSLMVSHIQT